MNVSEVSVIGAGSWGTTLANLLAEKGYRVHLWVYEQEVCDAINRSRENPIYLPGFRLSELITAHNDIESALGDRSFIVMVVPSHVYRSVATDMIPHLRDGSVVVSATKGIENETLLTMSGVWRDILPEGRKIRYACLAGPSFAREVIRKIPTAVTVAAEDLDTARFIQQVMATEYFRVYTSTDIIGLEVAGAVKNVLALAAGASDGFGYGHNTRAALITRGLAEMTRLGVAMGAHPLTFLGLPGVGDLLLTCTSELSRNRTVGYEMGRGKSLDEVLSGMKMVAEGVKTARSVYNLAKRLKVDMPICERVYSVLYEGEDPREAVKALLSRTLKHEWEYELQRFWPDISTNR
ncbi:NAD(P)H-dependent glycerol-3-phosphate dehydrogenase [Thermodesulforhabdus norvegica]|uniref:Glycerol-3-phosphate dehydrogenase [NAD(P)+] n=1 Tax=Thermodesulforhabdus norvegica TaxID=39841 RepID=A0A1I4SF95_9BACT|nr:NAD(P)H-dependent glycerol-3-phosphate dehydrogenase [Thermodesulforhabdus norvegica]SFM63122.1 glycerol 3-phosphate dehydrogenase (NAD(P)+) [Thermodesulforhabdus norvegica]